VRSLFEKMSAASGPHAFTMAALAKAEDLFRDRSALYFTPTEGVPRRWVGDGPLSVRLPIATPFYDETFEMRCYMSPRLWVDLLQRATGKIRWRPMNPARILFRRFDVKTYREDIVISGVKALVDALKVRTSGRRDGYYIQYFGAIVDDSQEYLSSLTLEQHVVDSPAEGAVELLVDQAAPPNSA